MVQPFSTGSQYIDWQARNCERCKKVDWDDINKTCPLDRALGNAMIGDGQITDEEATRIGYFDNRNNYTWSCPEIEKDESE